MIKNLLLICIFLLPSSACYSSEVTTYYFIRHAEKLRIDKTDQNPKLNEEGLKRSEVWRTVFSNVNFDAVYSTDYSRTKLTAKATADSKNLPILLYDPNYTYVRRNKRSQEVNTIFIFEIGRN